MIGGRSEALLQRLEHFGIRLGLERIRGLLAHLADPHLVTSCVLVGGTNGKGSTSALLASMCRAAGYRTGHFVSPHLETVTERLSIDGRAISDDELASLLENILALAERQRADPPTYFEALTLAAWLYFAERQVDVAILEVGLGGRLDATNTCEPCLSLITSIDFDHEKQLGGTLESIAREKAGILRRGRPAVAWAGDSERRRLLKALASEHGAELMLADEVFTETLTAPDAVPQRAVLRCADQAYDLTLHLAGRHQLRNLAVAVRAARALATQLPRLDKQAIELGASQCRWPGRMEWVLLSDQRRILLDAAHNPAGARTLGDYLSTLKGPCDLLFGALADKRIAEMLGALAPHARNIVLTKPPSDRAEDPRAWLEDLPEHSPLVEPDLELAFERALAFPGDVPLVISGSIYLIGEIRGRLRQRFGVPGPVLETADQNLSS